MTVLRWLHWYWVDSPRCSFGIPHRPSPVDQRVIDAMLEPFYARGQYQVAIRATCRRCGRKML